MNKTLLTLLIIFCNLSLSLAATAPPVNFGKTHKETFSVFPISSEIQIGKILPFVQKAPKGIYLTVGSERGFRAASMTPNITYLILLDLSEDIIRYNLINKELLKANNRQAYLNLRWDADFKTWQDFKAQVENDHHVNVELTKEDYDWWQKKVRDISAMPYQLPEFLNKHKKSPVCTNTKLSKEERKLNLGEIIDFKTGNYLFYDNLYDHLHRLAIENKIYTAQINLLDKTQVDKLIAYLKEQDLKIGVLDLDNLYYKDYLGQDAYYDVLQKLLPLGQNDSILIAMSNYKDYACGQFQIYIGFTFENIKQWKPHFKMQDFIDSFPEKVNDLINGRLYEKDEALPTFKN